MKPYPKYKKGQEFYVSNGYRCWWILITALFRKNGKWHYWVIRDADGTKDIYTEKNIEDMQKEPPKSGRYAPKKP